MEWEPAYVSSRTLCTLMVNFLTMTGRVWGVCRVRSELFTAPQAESGLPSGEPNSRVNTHTQTRSEKTEVSAGAALAQAVGGQSLSGTAQRTL